MEALASAENNGNMNLEATAQYTNNDGSKEEELSGTGNNSAPPSVQISDSQFEDFGFTNYSNLGELTKEKLMMGRTRSGSFSGVDSPRDATYSPRRKDLV